MQPSTSALGAPGVPGRDAPCLVGGTAGRVREPTTGDARLRRVFVGFMSALSIALSQPAARRGPPPPAPGAAPPPGPRPGPWSGHRSRRSYDPDRSRRPAPCRQLRRDIDDLFAGREEPLCDVPADTTATLDRPHPMREPADVQHTSRRTLVVSGVPATTLDRLVTAITSIVTERLCGSIPITTRRCSDLPASSIARYVGPESTAA